MPNPMRANTVRLTMTVVLGAALAACSGTTAEVPQQTVTATAANAHLNIGVSFDEPGISQKTGDNPPEGFDVETAKYVAAKLGVPATNITWIDAKPAVRESLLTSGQVDLVFATYSITDERKKLVDFAGPYFVAHQDLLVRRNDTSITGPTTLDGRTLCSVTNTTSAAYVAKTYAGKITLVEKENYSDCVKSLLAGDVDAVTTDDLILAGFAAAPAYKGILKVVGNGFTDERYGVGIKKGNTEMVTKVNAALKSYIDDGTWAKALDKYVAPSGYVIPKPPTPGS